MCAAERGVFSLLTPPGEGGIAVFAVEGPGARAALAQAVLSRRITPLKSGELAYGQLLDAGGTVLDEVIVAALPLVADNVERFELNCHAGGAAAAAAARRLRELGLEERPEPPEEPGLDPVEAEFRRALLRVKTRRQLEALCRRRAGRPAENIDAILKTHRVVIAGPVNAGKSTLLNRLAGSDRAIVSPHPGTTRDAVAAEVSVRGLAVELVDTAGLGAVAGDGLAPEAQEISRREVAGADLALIVLDGSEPCGAEARAEIESILRTARRSILVLSKSDLAVAEPRFLVPGSWFLVEVSALTGAGLDALTVAIERTLLGNAECAGWKETAAHPA